MLPSRNGGLLTIHAEIAAEKERKRLKLTHPEPLEAQVLRNVMHVLQRHPLVGAVWRTNTAAGHLTRRSGGPSQFMRFGFKGQPDLCGYLRDGRALYVEVKRPSGEVTPEQRTFIDRAAHHGCMAFVARGIDDVMAALETR